MGWILVGKTKHGDVAMMSKYAPDLACDRFYLWLDKFHWLPMIVLGVLLYALGGLPFALRESSKAYDSDCGSRKLRSD